jgi:hypothetical protein
MPTGPLPLLDVVAVVVVVVVALIALASVAECLANNVDVLKKKRVAASARETQASPWPPLPWSRLGIHTIPIG